MAQPSCMTLFSVAANGVPVNQVVTLASEEGATERRYSASKRTFSNLLLVEAIARAVFANCSKRSEKSGARPPTDTGPAASVAGLGSRESALTPALSPRRGRRADVAGGEARSATD